MFKGFILADFLTCLIIAMVVIIKEDFDKSLVGKYRLEFIPKVVSAEKATVSLDKLTKKNKSLQESMTAQKEHRKIAIIPEAFWNIRI